MPDAIDPIVAPPRSPADLTGLSDAAGVPQMVQALGGALGNIAALPKQAFEASEGLRNTGEYNPAPVTQIASMLAGGGLPAAEEGAAGIFGGRLARTADLPALYKARMNELKGATPLDNLNDTGWFKGADKQWRFEIPDTGATVNKSIPWGANSGVQVKTTNLGDTLKHPSLYEAYPDMENIGINWNQAPGYAFHREAYPGIIGLSPSDSSSSLIPTALHEAQHGVQWREGFAPGASSSEMEVPAIKALEQPGMVKRTSPTQYVPTTDHPDIEGLLNKVKYEAYKRNAGEVEARNVANRFSMPPDARWSPWSTEDVPRDKQIIRAPSQSPYQGILDALNK